MMFISGRVAKLIRNADGQLTRLQLQDGWEVRFSEQLGNQLACAISEGSAVAIEGLPRSDDFTGGYIYATRISNAASGETLPALKRKGKPGMQTSITPAENASLATFEVQPKPARLNDQGDSSDNQPISEAGVPDAQAEMAEEPAKDQQSTHAKGQQGSNEEGGRQCEARRPPRGPGNAQGASDHVASHPGWCFPSLAPETDPRGAHCEQNDAARSIGVAYDSLHRLQAILAYLHIMKHRVPGIGQFLDEAKHTYIQGLSRFTAGDYSGAKEFAEASESLARVVEIVMGRTLRSDSTLPSVVPPPPQHLGPAPEPEHVEENLAHAESVLARIHWVLEHGTLPSDDRAQVRKIASWGDAFYKQAQYTYRHAVLEDASEFAQAALAGAHSAEHVCRKWYFHH